VALGEEKMRHSTVNVVLCVKKSEKIVFSGLFFVVPAGFCCF
jgi:hypothetical protein